MDKLKAIIIEDEELARNLLKNYLLDIDNIELIGEFSDGFAGLKAINELSPDVVFLDIQMPKLTGLEVLELLDNMPSIIFTTAYDDYAVKAFELNAIDYLLKPFSRERFLKAVKKATKNSVDNKVQLQDFKNQVIKNKKLDKIVIKTSNNLHIINLHEINYISSEDDYVMIHTSKGKYLKNQTMNYYETHLNSSDFVRIHRSYIVNIQQINKIEKFGKETYQVILKDDCHLKISRSRYQELKQILDF